MLDREGERPREPSILGSLWKSGLAGRSPSSARVWPDGLWSAHFHMEDAADDVGGYRLLAVLCLLLSLTPCFSGVSAERAGLSTGSAVSAPLRGPRSAPSTPWTRCWRPSAAAMRSTGPSTAYRVLPHGQQHSDQPPQKTDCTLLIHGKNFRNEVRDAKGRKGREYRINGVRAEVGAAGRVLTRFCLRMMPTARSWATASSTTPTIMALTPDAWSP